MYQWTGASNRNNNKKKRIPELCMALSTPGSMTCYCATLSSEIRAKSPGKARDVTGFKSLTNFIISTPH